MNFIDKKKKKWWILTTAIILLVILIATAGILFDTYDPYGLPILFFNYLGYPFTPKTTDEVKAFQEKTSYIKGVCHPNDDLASVAEANIEWVRVDIPFPYALGGGLTEDYLAFKETLQKFKDNGLQTMAVTPYPRDYLAYGLDPRAKSSDAGIQEIAKFFCNDLRDLIGGIQITNEMGNPFFMEPLSTVEQAGRFIGIQAKAMMDVKGDIIVGYNSATLEAVTHKNVKPYLDYMDYVGIDIYIGNFEGMVKNIKFFDIFIKYLWNYTRKPIILMEFGYIGGGEPKTDQQRLEILNGFGASSEADAKANIEAFVSALPEAMQAQVRAKVTDRNDLASATFGLEMRTHLYKELPSDFFLKGYPHSPEGQAAFFKYLIPHLESYPFICGSFVYCYKQDLTCYVCGQEGCPIETQWGLVTATNEKKPSYYAVQEAYANIKR